MVWGEPAAEQDEITELVDPRSLLHLKDKIRFPLDPDTWVDFLRDFDFVLGTRIHGSVAGILSGTPTLLLAHDSRTRELADYHQIPYLPLDKITENTRAEDLYEYADYTKFHDGLEETFDRFVSFLDKNDLPNIYQPDQKANDYDEKLSNAVLPPMVHPILAEGEAGRREMVSRLWWLRQGKKVDNGRLRYAFKPDLPHTKKPELTARSVDKRLTRQTKELKDELSRTAEQLTETQQLVKAQAKIIERLDVPMSKRAKRYVRRVVRKRKRD